MSRSPRAGVAGLALLLWLLGAGCLVWSPPAPDDDDSASDDDDSAAVDDDDSTADDDDSVTPGDDDDDGGCTCDASSRSAVEAPWGLLLLTLAGAQRRRRGALGR